MTTAALTPSVSYIENGATVAFAVPFRFNSGSDVKAEREAADGTRTPLTYGTDYSCTGGATDAGGTLTVTAAAVAGTRLHIWRETLRSQTTDYALGDTFPAETHEAALDKLALVDQEQDVDLARAPKVERGKTALAMGDIAAGQVVGRVGDKLVGIDNDPAAVAELAEQVTSDAAQVALDAVATGADRAAVAADRAATQLLHDETEGYRDAAIAGASGTYADTAAGLAGTSEGDYFTVPAAPDGYMALYLHAAGPVATLIDTLPNAAAVEAAIVEAQAAAKTLASSLSEAFAVDFGQDEAFLAGTPITQNIHFFLTPIEQAGTINAVECWDSAAGTCEIGVYRDVGGTMTYQGKASFTTTGAAAEVTRALDGPLAVEAGDHIAFHARAPGLIGYRNRTDDGYFGDGYHQTADAEFPATVALGTTSLKIEPQLRVVIDYEVQTVTHATVKPLIDRAQFVLPDNALRLKRAFFDGEKRKVMAVDPVTAVTVNSGSATLTGGGVTTYAKESPLIRRLGGIWQAGPIFPDNNLMIQKNTSYAVGDVRGRNPMWEIVIPAGVTAFEFPTKGARIAGYKLWIEFDGKLGNATGYTNPNPSGTLQFVKVAITPFAEPVRVRIYGTAVQYFGEVRVEGGELLDPAPAYSASAYWYGDSITEGAATSDDFYRWIMIVNRRLGIDNFAPGGVGATGYVAAPSPKLAFKDRLSDALTMVDGGPPDMMGCFAGINDAYTTTGDKDAFAAAVAEFYQGYRDAAPNSLIVAGGPLPGKFGYNDELRAKAEVIRETVREIPRAVFIDIEAVFDVPEWETYFGADVTHAEDPGHAYMGAEFPPLTRRGIAEFLG